MVVLTSKVGTKGQIVIPKPVRDELQLRPGDRVSVSVHEGHAHVQKSVPKDPEMAWQEFFDAIPRRRGVTLQQIKRDIDEQYAQRARRAGIKS